MKTVLKFGLPMFFLICITSACGGFDSKDRTKSDSDTQFEKLPEQFCGVYEGFSIPENWNLKLSSMDKLDVFIEVKNNGRWIMIDQTDEIALGTYKAQNNSGTYHRINPDGTKKRLKNEDWKLKLKTEKGSCLEYLDNEEIILRFDEYTIFKKHNHYFNTHTVPYKNRTRSNYVFLKTNHRTLDSITQKTQKDS